MERIGKGDVVAAGLEGPWMTVVACSQNTALCTWENDGALRSEVFRIDELRKRPAQQQQQAQQPQPHPGSSESKGDASDEQP